MLLILGKTGIPSAWPEPVRGAAVSAESGKERNPAGT